MGEPIRLVISVDAETQRILNRWQEQFSPLVGTNRSRLVRLAVQTLDRLGFTAQTVMEALNAPQRINTAHVEQPLATLNNSSQVPAFPVDGRPKPLTRIVAPPSKGVRGREFRGVSRRMAANEAWFGTSLIIHSTPLNERAA